jgi:hypothetical protein
MRETSSAVSVSSAARANLAGEAARTAATIHRTRYRGA